MIVKIPVQFNGYVEIDVNSDLNYEEAMALASKLALVSVSAMIDHDGDNDIDAALSSYQDESCLSEEEAETEWCCAGVNNIIGIWKEGDTTPEAIDASIPDDIEAEDEDEDEDEEEYDQDEVQVDDSGCPICGFLYEDDDEYKICIECGITHANALAKCKS
jgi:rubrerythrin